TNAAYSLGRLGDRQAVEPLMDAVHLDDSRVKNRAIDSLGAIADKRALPILIDTLQDKDRVTRTNSAIALGKIGDKRAVDPLLQTLADPDSNTRRATIQALTSIADERAFDPINSLAKLGGVKAIDPLLEVFQGKSLELRNLAAIALGQIRQPEAVKSMLKLMAQVDLTSIPDLRPALSLFFKEAGSEASNQLKNSLTDNDLATRQQALLLTAILADPSSIESLITALKDSSSEMRALAALLIGRSRDLKAVPALRKALEDQNESVRSKVGEALALIGVPKYEPPKVLSDANTMASVESRNSNVPTITTTPAQTPLRPLPITPNTNATATVGRGNDVPLTASNVPTNAPKPPTESLPQTPKTTAPDLVASNNIGNLSTNPPKALPAPPVESTSEKPIVKPDTIKLPILLLATKSGAVVLGVCGKDSVGG
ncbi:MAG: PBS lyase, partial [bacterium]